MSNAILLEKYAWGIQRILMTYSGDYTMGILILLGNRGNPDDFCGELRMRIFILLRNKLCVEEGLLLVLYPKMFPLILSTFLIIRLLELKIKLGFALLKTSPCTDDLK